MNCWNLLGIEDDADARTVKRQYARLLKQTRPDDDPEGFQRLREAYDQALAYVQWREENDYEQDVAPEPIAAAPLELTGTAQEAHQDEALADAPALVELPTASPIQLTSLEPDALDATLNLADARGERSHFEKLLLARCASEGERALPAIEWAIQRLHWFSAQQRVDLDPGALRRLADHLLSARFDQLSCALAEADYTHERKALDLIKHMLCEPWLQGFDQRTHFHLRLAALLTETEGWSAPFFDRLCGLVGWDEQRGVLPIPHFQYQQLEQRIRLGAAVEAVQRDLSVGEPSSAREKAAWFLFKPLSNGKRRQMADAFDAHTWMACDELEMTVSRNDGMLDRLGVEDMIDWRRWATGVSRGDYYLICWPLLFALYLMIGKAVNAHALLVAAVGATLYVVVGAWIIKFWKGVAVRLAGIDVWLGERIIPARYCRAGTGLLPLRHVLPTLLAGVLLSNIGASAPGAYGVVLGVAAALALLATLNYVLAVPAGRPPIWMRAVALVRNNGKNIFIWVAVTALFIGLGALKSL